jgi:hypothetical protein
MLKHDGNSTHRGVAVEGFLTMDGEKGEWRAWTDSE